MPDTDRLYTNPDELLFKPDRSPNAATITADELSYRQFFLTSSSRAPETTVFGTPRVSLWPLNSPVGSPSTPALSSDRTVKDRLIAFSTWLGNATVGNSYSFERQIGTNGFLNADDTGADSPSRDVSRARNQALLTYLRSLGAQAVPGFGGTFQSKWGGTNGVNHVLAQVFDTVRASINTDYVQQGTTSYQYGAFPGNPRSISVNATAGVLDQANDQSAPRGFVVPSKVGNALGAGRYVTIAGVSIVIMPTEVVNTYGNVTLTNNTTWSGTETCAADAEPVYRDTGNNIVSVSLPPDAVPTSQVTNKVRAFVLFQPYFPVPGMPSFAPGARLAVRGLNSITIAGQPLGPSNAETRFGSAGGFGQYALANFQMTSPAYFFYYPPMAVPVVPGSPSRFRAFVKWPGTSGTPGPLSPSGVFTQALDTTYPFVSDEIDVTGQSTIAITGGNLNVEIQSWKSGETIQTFELNFPGSFQFPVPQHRTTGGDFKSAPPSPQWLGSEFAQGRITPSTGVYPWHTANLSPAANVYGDYLSLWRRMRLGDDGSLLSKNLVRSGDIVLSLVPRNDGPLGGDLRLIALTANVPSAWFTTGPGYGTTLMNGGSRMPLSFRNDAVIIQSSNARAAQMGWRVNGSGFSIFRLKEDVAENASLISGLDFGEQATPISAPGVASARLGGGSAIGDWSSPAGSMKDGASFPRPEAGLPTGVYGGFWSMGTQAFNYAVVQDATFEPNRVVPSAGVLGGILAPDANSNLQPWRTLLFSAWPAAGRSFSDSGNGSPMGDHPGATGGPPDHLFLDNFWMPAVEPYAISESMSTAGKVNLNFQIAPFTYIQRSTALRGALKPVMVAAVPDSTVTPGVGTNGNQQNYKYGRAFDPIPTPIRYQLDLEQTVGEFAKRFGGGGVYKSATSVAEVPMIPLEQNGSPISSLDSFWNNHRVTGDNLREQPYTAVLSRVTTQSNSYTVHMLVQAVKKVPGTPPDAFVPGRDQITGEWRGSYQIERYIDSNDSAVQNTDFASVPLRSLGPFYLFRILNTTQFAP
jgi:uncharacterized protein (TIGR02600 family)